MHHLPQTQERQQEREVKREGEVKKERNSLFIQFLEKEQQQYPEGENLTEVQTL